LKKKPENNWAELHGTGQEPAYAAGVLASHRSQCPSTSPSAAVTNSISVRIPTLDPWQRVHGSPGRWWVTGKFPLPTPPGPKARAPKPGGELGRGWYLILLPWRAKASWYRCTQSSWKINSTFLARCP